MPRDYSKYRSEKPSARGSYKRRASAEPSSNGGMVWLLMGVLIGLCIAGFAYLNQNKAHLKELARNTLVQTAGSLATTASSNTPGNQSKQSTKLATAQNTANTPQFDFYNMLPAGQVSGPTGDDNATANHQATVKTAAAVTSPPTEANASTNNTANNSENNGADNSADNSENNATNSSNNSATNAISNKQTNNETNSSSNNSATNAVNNDAVNSNSSGVSAAETAGSNSLASNEEKALTHGIAAPATSTVALNTTKKAKKLHALAATNDTTPDGSAMPATDSTAGSSGTDATATPVVATNATSTNAAASSTPKTAKYVIQLAAFSHYDQADQLKAQLAFSGFEAKIAPLQKGKNTLQRVWMGPYTSLSAAAAVQRQLTENQMKSTLLKIG